MSVGECGQPHVLPTCLPEDPVPQAASPSLRVKLAETRWPSSEVYQVLITGHRPHHFKNIRMKSLKE